tara:strand:+ start:892 stop:1686 length:795 start_codon:yes stop_codon:yes gene_type:complete
MNQESLVLFDVDGTLTEARQAIQTPMISALRELCEYCEIGLVTGSGLEYIKEQLWPIFNSNIIKRNCHLLPCNGTEYLVPTEDKEIAFHTVTANSMIKEMGASEFNKLMAMLCDLQSRVSLNYPIPLSGHFIQNRESMVNWCPIGRNATTEQRKEFELLDKEHRIRLKYMSLLSDAIKDLGLTVKLGGDTSFDIYPCGWDKTYALNHFDIEAWDIWFVGDRCYPEGNDYELFELLKHQERSFETGGPDETIEIINNYILKEIGY